MVNKISYLFILIGLSSWSMAQNNAIFNGGNADGYDKNSYQQLSNINNIVFGGDGDGHSKDCYVQTSNLHAIHSGGDGDGHSKDCYMQTSNLHAIHSGGNGDGHSKDCYTQTSNLNAIYTSGSGDGHAKDCYTQASNLNPIFSGGNGGDGMLNGCANEPLGCFLAINLGNDTTFCNGNTLTLDAGSFPGGATYLWQDSSASQTLVVDTSGIYYVNVTDTAGCTGIDSITVTVNPVPVVDLGIDTAFCNGNSLVLDAQNSGATYLWQNTPTAPYQNQTLTVNTTGTYYVTASFGTCTDTDSINVTVHPIVTTNLTDAIICQGDSALIHGVYQSVAGTYRDTISASTGCDSILVQQLIVNPTYNQNLGTVNICQGDSAMILGNYETVAGVYSDTLPSINGCDSIVTQTLNVDPVHVVDLGNDTSFCAGNNLVLDAGAGANSYLWQNNPIPAYQNQTLTVNSTGTYYVVTTLGACNTSDTIQVTVNPIQYTNLTDSVICQGDSSMIFGNYETVAGTYRDTLAASTGCDSILVQQLIVNPTYNNNLGTVSICDGDSALIFGNYESISGVYYDTLSTINGCDSIVYQTLSVLSNSSVNLGNDTTFCAGNVLTLDAGAGDSYLWQDGFTNTQTYNVTSTGTYYVTVNVGACSAIDSIDVIVNPIQNTNLPDSIICQGDSSMIFGNYESIAGNYYDTLTASTGCDSILIQQLIVNPTYNQTLGAVNICQGDSAMILGNYETVAGVYSDTLQSISGCDSIVTQTLNVDPVHVVDLGNDTTFCAGNILTLDAGAGASSYLWQNNPIPSHQNQTFNVSSSGTYYVVTILGACTTSDTIQVTVNPIQYTNLTDSVICQGDSSMIFGNYETMAGNYYDTLTASTGCDSILVQQLMVNPTYNNNLGTVSICAGDSALILGNYETVAGVYADTLQSINGCDSIVTQTLNIDATPVVNLGNDTTFCSGNALTLDAGAGADTYLWMSNPVPSHQNQTFNVANTGTYYVTATIGVCSATDSINVTVIQPVYTNLSDVMVCQGDSALIFGSYETVAGNYYDTLAATTTCDSVLVQQLIVNPNYTVPQTISICNGDSVLLGGTYQNTAGTYYDTLSTVNGCDSVMVSTLVVNPVYNINTAAAICDGDSILLGGTYQTTAGTYTDTLPSINGCDSIVNTTLTINPVYLINQTAEICQGDSILLGGTYQNTAGTYYDVYNSSMGCDSTVATTLTVHPVYTTPLTDVNICNGDSILIFGNYESAAGTYSTTLQSVNGCDSIVTQELIVSPVYNVNVNAEICQGDSILLGGAYQTSAGTYYDVYSSSMGCDSTVATMLTIINGYVTNLNDTICEGESLLVGGAYQTVSGIYYDSLQALSGCDSLVITSLLVSPIPTVIVTAEPSFIVPGQSSQLMATGGGTYEWTPGGDLSCSNCENPVATPIQTTLYTVTVDSNGCVVSDTVSVTVDDEFFIPEGFSPNNDGINDLFEIVGIGKYPKNNITIINRWGNKVFEAAPYNGDWNGTNQFGVSFGEKLPSGTYFYILELGIAGPSGEQEIKGYIYLNR